MSIIFPVLFKLAVLFLPVPITNAALPFPSGFFLYINCLEAQKERHYISVPLEPSFFQLAAWLGDECATPNLS